MRPIGRYGGGGEDVHRRQRNDSESPECLDGIPQNSTPEGYLHLRPSSNEDRDTPVAAAAGAGGAANASSPLLALAVGLLTLLWMWVIEGRWAMLPARLRGGRTTLGGLELGQKNGRACRCRVCMLRMQAQGQPLHHGIRNEA